MPLRFPRASVNRPIHWLLELEVGGTAYRFADEELAVTQGSISYRYLPGLGGLSVELGAPSLSVAIELDAGAGGVSWSELVTRGVDLESTRATLRLWAEGLDRAEALVVVAGYLVAPEYGSIDEPFSFSIEGRRYESTATIPPIEAAIDDTTWPITTSPFPLQPDPQAIGAVYPWIYGRPGRDGISVWGRWSYAAPASPAYVAEYGDGAHTINDSKLIIAGHPVGAATVEVTDVSAGYSPGPRPSTPPAVSSTLTVSEATDGRGRVVSVVERSDGDRMRIIAGNEYWVAWTTGGGRVEGGTGEEIRGAGAVIEDLLREAGIAFDRGRLAAARGKLDAIRLDFALTDPVRPEDWIQSALGGLVPLLRQESADGVWYELWRYDATYRDVEAWLSADEDEGGIGVTRTSRVVWTDRDAVENDITLQYRRCKQGFARTRRLYATLDPSSADYEQAAQLAVISEERYGRRPVTIESAIIAEDAAADTVLGWRILWRGIARRSFEVEGGPELLTLGTNSVVAYSEEALGLDSALALVTSAVVDLTGVVLRLELLDEPAARGRA